jgi:RNA polymerase sigma-70 factor, ECF subfamily
MSDEPARRRLRAVRSDRPAQRVELDELLVAAGRGDRDAFERVYDALAGPVFGLARHIARDPARAEEVTQDVFVSVWRLATRFDPAKGSARTWVMTMTHRRTVDVVRSAQAASEREIRAHNHETPFDTVSEQVTTRIEGEQVRQCMEALTDVQRAAVTLAYYGGYTYPEVSTLLGLNRSTLKTRIRDGLIRLRDCLGGAR